MYIYFNKDTICTTKDTMGYFIRYAADLHVRDTQATAAVMYDMISATVDRIVFGSGAIDRERPIGEVIEMLSTYFTRV